MFRYDKKKYLSQFLPEMFDSLQLNSTKCAPQEKPNNFIIMATLWVPDLPNIKGFSGHLWNPILIFANDAQYRSSNKDINMLAHACALIYSL